jgi:hypothetical protein
MEQAPTLSQLLKQAIDNRLVDVHTALIGRVERYDHKTQLADIQPVLKRSLKILDGSSIQEQLPLLSEVPVLFPRAGGFFCSFPIQPGDFVQIIFNETSIDEFLAEKPTRIGSSERFCLHGAIAIPGVYPLSKPLTGAHGANLVMGKDKGVQLHIDGEKIRLGSDVADEALALAKNVKRELEKFRSAFNSHTHIATAAFGAVTNAPTTTQITPTADIATKKVVAE